MYMMAIPRSARGFQRLCAHGVVWAWILVLQGCGVLWPARDASSPASGTPPPAGKPAASSSAPMPTRTGPLTAVVVLVDQEMVETALEAYVGYALVHQRKDVAAFTAGLTNTLKSELTSAQVATEAHTLNFSDTVSRAKVRLQNRPTLVIRMLSFARPATGRPAPGIIPPASSTAAAKRGSSPAPLTRGAPATATAAGKTVKSANAATPVAKESSASASDRPPFVEGATEWSAQLSESVGTNAYSTTWRTQIDDVFLGPVRCKNYEACGRSLAMVMLAQMRRDGLIR
jgi:hypothetical protein